MIIMRCVQETEQGGIMEKITQHHMENTLQEIKQLREFSNHVFISLHYSTC